MERIFPVFSQLHEERSAVLTASRTKKYFQRFGCLRCERTDQSYGGDGFCKGCRELIVLQLKHLFQNGR